MHYFVIYHHFGSVNFHQYWNLLNLLTYLRKIPIYLSYAIILKLIAGYHNLYLFVFTLFINFKDEWLEMLEELCLFTRNYSMEDDHQQLKYFRYHHEVIMKNYLDLLITSIWVMAKLRDWYLLSFAMTYFNLERSYSVLCLHPHQW